MSLAAWECRPVHICAGQKKGVVMASKIHIWEAQGLGKAPFHVVGFVTLPSANQNPSAYRSAMENLPGGYELGCCGACGHGLVNNFLIESSDKKKFAVGSDCVEKTGDAGLVNAANEAHKQEMAKTKYQKMLHRQEEYDRSQKEQRKNNGGKTDSECFEEYLESAKSDIFKAINQQMFELGQRLEDGKGGFRDDVARSFYSGQLPKGRGVKIVIDIFAKQKGKPNSAEYQIEIKRLSKQISLIAQDLNDNQEEWRQTSNRLMDDWKNNKDPHRWLIFASKVDDGMGCGPAPR